MGERYRLDDLLIDVDRQRVERAGATLEVQGLSFRLLHYLLRQDQRVVGFDELIAQVWAPTLVNEETVTQRVRLLRQALGDASRQPRYLRSVRGQGYQLCAPAQAVETSLPAAMTSPRRRRWLALGVVAAMTVVLALVAAFWHSRAHQTAPIAPLLQRADYYAGIGQRDNNERAIALYRQRLQEAPDDRQAQIGLSRSYSASVCQYGADPRNALQAQRLARQVVAAQPRLAAAHAALGYAHDCRGEVAQALASYETALRLDPGADAVRGSAAYLYERQGRLAEALTANLQVREPVKVRFLPIQIASNLSLLGYAGAAEARYRESFQLYPDSVFSNLAWPQFLFAHGRYAEAQAALDQARQRGTVHVGLLLLQAELALLRHDTAGARRASLQALQARPQGSLPRTVAWAVDAVPPPPETLRQHAQALLEGLAHGSDPLDGVDAALLLLTAGDPDAALQALDRARSAGYRDTAYLRASPLFEALRARPGFETLLARTEADVAVQRERVRRAGLLKEVIGPTTAGP